MMINGGSLNKDEGEDVDGDQRRMWEVRPVRLGRNGSR